MRLKPKRLDSIRRHCFPPSCTVATYCTRARQQAHTRQSMQTPLMWTMIEWEVQQVGQCAFPQPDACPTLAMQDCEAQRSRGNWLQVQALEKELIQFASLHDISISDTSDVSATAAPAGGAQLGPPSSTGTRHSSSSSSSSRGAVSKGGRAVACERGVRNRATQEQTYHAHHVRQALKSFSGRLKRLGIDGEVC
jgi:hypothetical protein